MSIISTVMPPRPRIKHYLPQGAFQCGQRVDAGSDHCSYRNDTHEYRYSDGTGTIRVATVNRRGVLRQHRYKHDLEHGIYNMDILSKSMENI